MFDHVLVDDYQDATFGAERLLASIRPASLVVAGNPDAHVFSFQGTTDVPLRRFEERFTGARRIELETDHRSDGVTARGLVRPAHVRGARRRRPRAPTPARGGGRPVARPRGDRAPPERAPGRAPAGARRRAGAPARPRERPRARGRAGDGAVRARAPLVGERPSDATRWWSRCWSPSSAGSRRRRRGACSARPAPRDVRRARRSSSRERFRRASANGSRRCGPRSSGPRRRRRRSPTPSARSGRSSPTPPASWPAPRRSEVARRDLEAVLAFARAVERSGGSADASVAAFVDLLEAGEGGPGVGGLGDADADSVRVLTAHGATGMEFDTVARRRRGGGRLPEPRPPRADVRPRRRSRATRRGPSGCGARLADERRLFASVLGRARRRVVLTASDPHAGEDGDALALRRGAGHRLVADARSRPASRSRSPRPRPCGDARSRTPRPRRRSGSPALDGLLALGDPAGALVVPARLDLHRPAAPRVAPPVLLAAGQARELRAAVRARRGARAVPARRLPGLGRQARPRAHRALRARRDRAEPRGARPPRSRPSGRTRRSRPRR